MRGELNLIFNQQRDSLAYSRGIIVPSEGMKRMLLRCYPFVPHERIHVLPWGTRPEAIDEAAVQLRAVELRRTYGISEDARVLLTLSRISPEKGQDRLLRALKLWENASDYPAGVLWVFICGEAAYMKGFPYLRTLQRLAKRLKKVRVAFPGFL